MTTINARWRTHTEFPTEPTAALIAIPPGPNDDAGATLLSGIYTWCQSRGWENESGGKKLKYPEFWWLDEVELVAPICPTSMVPA